MSLYSKGQFKIEESWNTNQNKKKTSSQRKSSNNQSLMHQLADSLAQPSTNLIDDSLSKLLEKQRSQPYNNIPKGKRQNTQMSNKGKTVDNKDGDFVSSMASRLQKLEKTCQSQRKQIKEQNQSMQKIKMQNAFLKGMNEDSAKTFDEMNKLKNQNVQLSKKVLQMQAYLKQYGLKWVGHKIQGKLDDKSIKKDIKQSKYAYRLPSQIDINSIRRRIDQLNAGLEQQGMGTQIVNEKGVHKFRKAQNLPIGFYSNGIVIKGFNFYSYKSKQSLKILADILDGYFPYIFKQKYPNGVLLQVVDHIQKEYIQQKSQQKVASLDSNKDFEPMSKQELLNKIPEKVVKNGKVIEVRKGIEKMFDGTSQIQQSQYICVKDGNSFIKTQCWNKIQKGQLDEQAACSLKIRLENGTIYLVLMEKQNNIIDVFTELRKVIRSDFKLMKNYPKCVYDGNESQNLEDLGFFPNENLQICK